ncbi:viperin family antiviral radical SAM protein [Marinobacter sp. F4216]|uniref:viperin family antiviral radical SAM protein n=1 Tax=Marinobacter sp. F4216 TaxID=2874281 RepID=UPI001CBC5BBB|nr:viperin family antiviral radical SAM protein [Marinobacter sp. F4216]MBZ2169844.1 viperin family antiviral radical SAM protein [Marinobacter sp. F4216]
MHTNTDFVPTNPLATPLNGMLAVNELTINWHVTEACNYRCHYCYAKWKDAPSSRELFHDPDRTRDLLGELFDYFQPTNNSNPLSRQITWKGLRLNLAGGEPSILGDRLIEIAQTAREIGFQLSIISNGARLSKDALTELAPHLTCLGISLDSTDTNSNQRIGRTTRKGEHLDLAELLANIELARRINPQLTIKLNTVVNLLNAKEDLSEFVTELRPDRWKVLRVLPVIDDSLAISDDQFSDYVERHRSFESLQCVEDNTDTRESYLMVDPFGRFFQNQLSPDGGYQYSQPILSVGAHAAFSEMAFNPSRYHSRYSKEAGGTL